MSYGRVCIDETVWLNVDRLWLEDGKLWFEAAGMLREWLLKRP